MAGLADTLDELLRVRNISQRDLAARAGIHAQTLNKILGGRIKDPGFSVVGRLAAALDLSMSDFTRLLESSHEHEDPREREISIMTSAYVANAEMAAARGDDLEHQFYQRLADEAKDLINKSWERAETAVELQLDPELQRLSELWNEVISLGPDKRPTMVRAIEWLLHGDSRNVGQQQHETQLPEASRAAREDVTLDIGSPPHDRSRR